MTDERENALGIGRRGFFRVSEEIMSFMYSKRVLSKHSAQPSSL